MNATLIPAALALACAGIACTPDLNWREVRPEGTGLAVLLPCRPAGHARQLNLAGIAVEMSLFACTAGGATYAVGSADVGYPHLVGRALEELATAAARNITAAGPQSVASVNVSGMTPQPRAARWALAGQLSDGRRVQEHVAVFARGSRIYQATVVGTQIDAEAVESFFGSLRLLP
jgi:hypothetical protein